jgi:hypothetical protein
MKQVYERCVERGDMKNPNGFRWFHKFLNKPEINGRTRPLKLMAGEASRCGEDKSASFEGPSGQRSQVRAA